jgi:Mg-chelatase subunit ChlD
MSNRNRLPRDRRNRRGFAIILSALMLVWVIPMVGLVIDVGVMYSIKARLTAACDAAAISAARSLSTGVSIADQSYAATQRAEAFFKANFPLGTMESNDRQVQVTVAETQARVRTVQVSGSAAAPVYFMQMLGSNRTVVSAVAEASRRDVNVMLVIDRSGSLQDADACDDVEDAARVFVGMFANGRDRVGFITFGGDYRVDYPPVKNFKQSPSASDELDKLFPGGCRGWTGSAQGLWAGYKELEKVAEPGAQTILVFFTDGKPNTITADWKVRIDPGGSGSRSRCWDWEHNVPESNGAWNPVNQAYRGYVTENGDGVRTHDSPAMPLGSYPGQVAIPNGYSGGPKPVAQDCKYLSNPWNAEEDIAYYPTADLYGNHTNTGYKPVTLINGGPYDGFLRRDDLTTRQNAAINAVDHAAVRIRNKELNPNMPVMVYTIGLGGAGAAEHELLKRIANTDDSPTHTDSAPTGEYIFAPTSAQLVSAFQKAGGEALRLSK